MFKYLSVVVAGSVVALMSAVSPASALPVQAGVRVCVSVPGTAACHAILRPNATTANPSGYRPSDLQSAYKVPALAGGLVAVVDAYDDPTAEADLAMYRSTFGLPPCTTQNGCFRKVNQNGGTSYPPKSAGWATEISLDLDMVSAICPACHIVLVEATSASYANLGIAENQAASYHPAAISNSFGGSDASDATYGASYNHPGIAITASSGDNGYGVEYPASSRYVTAVGGTTLTRSSNARGWSETAWSGAGSGCSSYNTKLAAQSTTVTGCSNRAVADVSAVADPSTGVAVYDSTRYQGRAGWMVFGGTSVAAPIIAAVYALAGNTASIDNNYLYTHATGLFDVVAGSNGACSVAQLCNARTGWDGPTGLGTPNGVSAF